MDTNFDRVELFGLSNIEIVEKFTAVFIFKIIKK